MKKAISLFLFTILLFTSTTAVASSSYIPQDEQFTTINDLIIEQIGEQNEHYSLSELQQFSIIESSSTNENVDLLNASTDTCNDKMLQNYTLCNDGYIECTTIIPYKTTSTGELVNSFSYVESPAFKESVSTSTVVTRKTTVVDATVSTSCTYKLIYSPTATTSFVQTGDLNVSWTSASNAKTVITYLNVKYVAVAELHAYPELLSTELGGSRISSNVKYISSVVQANPTKGATYTDRSGATPSNRALKCTDLVSHLGYVSIDIDYKNSSTGATGHRSDEATVFDKQTML